MQRRQHLQKCSHLVHSSHNNAISLNIITLIYIITLSLISTLPLIHAETAFRMDRKADDITMHDFVNRISHNGINNSNNYNNHDDVIDSTVIKSIPLDADTNTLDTIANIPPILLSTLTPPPSSATLPETTTTTTTMATLTIKDGHNNDPFTARAIAFSNDYNGREAYALIRLDCSRTIRCTSAMTIDLLPIGHQCLYGMSPLYSATIDWFNDVLDLIHQSSRDPSNGSIPTPWNDARLNNNHTNNQRALDDTSNYYYIWVRTLADSRCGYESRYDHTARGQLTIHGVQHGPPPIFRSTTTPILAQNITSSPIVKFTTGYGYDAPAIGIITVFNITFQQPFQLINAFTQSIEIIPVGHLQYNLPSMQPFYNSFKCTLYSTYENAINDLGNVVPSKWDFSLAQTNNLALQITDIFPIVPPSSQLPIYRISCQSAYIPADIRADLKWLPHASPKSMNSVIVWVHPTQSPTSYIPLKPYLWYFSIQDPMPYAKYEVWNIDESGPQPFDPEGDGEYKEHLQPAIHIAFPRDTNSVFTRFLIMVNCTHALTPCYGMDLQYTGVATCHDTRKPKNDMFNIVNSSVNSRSSSNNNNNNIINTSSVEITYSVSGDWYDSDFNHLDHFSYSDLVTPIVLFQPPMDAPHESHIYAMITVKSSVPCKWVKNSAEFKSVRLHGKRKDSLTQTILLSSRSGLMSSTPLFNLPSNMDVYTNPMAQFSIGYKYVSPKQRLRAIIKHRRTKTNLVHGINDDNNDFIPEDFNDNLKSKLHFNFTFLDPHSTVSPQFPGFEFIPIGLFNSIHPDITTLMSNVKCQYAKTKKQMLNGCFHDITLTSWTINRGMDYARTLQLDLFGDEKPLVAWSYYRIFCSVEFDLVSQDDIVNPPSHNDDDNEDMDELHQNHTSGQNNHSEPNESKSKSPPQFTLANVNTHYNWNDHFDKISPDNNNNNNLDNNNNNVDDVDDDSDEGFEDDFVLPSWLPTKTTPSLLNGFIVRPLDYSNSYVFTKVLEFTPESNFIDPDELGNRSSNFPLNPSPTILTWRDIIVDGDEIEPDDDDSDNPDHSNLALILIITIPLTLLLIAVIGFIGMRRLLHIRAYNRAVDEENAQKLAARIAQLQLEREEAQRQRQEELEQQEMLLHKQQSQNNYKSMRGVNTYKDVNSGMNNDNDETDQPLSDNNSENDNYSDDNRHDHEKISSLQNRRIKDNNDVKTIKSHDNMGHYTRLE